MYKNGPYVGSALTIKVKGVCVWKVPQIISTTVHVVSDVNMTLAAVIVADIE